MKRNRIVIDLGQGQQRGEVPRGLAGESRSRGGLRWVLLIIAVLLIMFVGGAALTRKFTATRIAPEYPGVTLYAKDAMDGLDLANQLFSAVTRDALIDRVRAEQSALVDTVVFDMAESSDMGVRGTPDIDPITFKLPSTSLANQMCCIDRAKARRSWGSRSGTTATDSDAIVAPSTCSPRPRRRPAPGRSCAS